MSIDKTIDYIPRDPRIRVFVTRDLGIYDAMDEALAQASGRYICFLNCGDVFANYSVLKSIYDASLARPGPVIFYCDFIDKDIFKTSVNRLNGFTLYKNPLNHQSMFYSRDVFSLCGTFDTGFKVMADYEFTLRAFFAGIKYVYCNIVAVRYEGGGFSESAIGAKQGRLEYNQIQAKYFSRWERVIYETLLVFSLREVRRRLMQNKKLYYFQKSYQRLANIINRII